MTAAPSLADALAAPGRNAVPFTDEGNPGRPVTLHTYRAACYGPDQPVVLVQHGMGRNGGDYRDFWAEAAERHGLLIVAPTFAVEHYPHPDGYNNGLLLDAAETPRPLDRTSYASIARVVALLRAASVTRRAEVMAFGHSAGAQFLHRLLATQAHDPFEAVTIGNAGWYTLPTLDQPFPDGLGGLGLDERALVRLLGFPLLVLAGDQDTATDDPSLPSGPAALRQGPHRFARAHAWVAAGRDAAARLGAPFGWRLQAVPGIGHDGAAMSAVAASLWFDGAMPSAAELQRLAGRRAA